MKKKIAVLIVLAALLVTAVPTAAYADMGPKPSVRIAFAQMGEELCYATLLSKTPSTGPASAWNGEEEDIRYGDLEPEIWRAFVGYRDEDGFYFLQTARRCDETKSFAWTYYPPQTFKVLLYYPETDTFAVSGICERYAFHSYFTVNVERTEASAPLKAVKSYDYTWEILSLICRIVLTAAIEIGLAFLFGFRGKKLMKLIIGVNVATQGILNIILTVIDYASGWMMFLLFYFLLEFVVFALEAVVYALFFNRLSEKRIHPLIAVLYALAANVLSFAAGLGLAILIPGIF